MKANNRSLISEVPEMLVSNAPSVREGKEVHQVRDIIHQMRNQLFDVGLTEK